MTQINLELCLLSEEKPLKAMFHPESNMVSVYAKVMNIDFAALLDLKQYNSFMNDIQKVNVQIGEQAIMDEKG